jgi:hypothetical protein
VWYEEDLYKISISLDEVIFKMGGDSKPKRDKLEKENLESERKEKEPQLMKQHRRKYWRRRLNY